jgi:hypothetical protein
VNFIPVSRRPKIMRRFGLLIVEIEEKEKKHMKSNVHVLNSTNGMLVQHTLRSIVQIYMYTQAASNVTNTQIKIATMSRLTLIYLYFYTL